MKVLRRGRIYNIIYKDIIMVLPEQGIAEIKSYLARRVAFLRIQT